MQKYCISRFNSVRRQTSVVNVGNVKIGGNNPIVVQSMTNTKTQDVEASIKQCIELAKAGCQIIRLTAQNIEAAKALKDISEGLRKAGFDTPLAADIHFLPKAAMFAAESVEKIRINPGNYTDKKRSRVEYNEKEYQEELEKVREEFIPFLKRCKELGRAIRIGTNHGSLSERIVCRYGDTSLGMVESALEFARICKDENFDNFLFSFKSSNTRVMTQTYRLAVSMMEKEGFKNPLHLGVTEAGFGRDARIKSSIGIGSLLSDGLGDTIRVSLTEDPVEEIPVAKDIVNLIEKNHTDKAVEAIDESINFYTYQRSQTSEVDLGNIKVGSGSIPAVVSFGKSKSADVCVDEENTNLITKKYTAKEELISDLNKYKAVAAQVDTKFIKDNAQDLKNAKNLIIVPSSANEGRSNIGEVRYTKALMDNLEIKSPIWLKFDSDKAISSDEDSLINEASMYIGTLICEGIGDLVSVEFLNTPEDNAKLALDILQGSRARRSKAEYIACPSCGRTLYNIQEAASKIQKATSHLKNITIGIMGCIVNGPGEMADADFGYVGGAPGKINLYKGKECVQTNINQEEAIEKLIELIKKEGSWQDPE